MYKKLRNSLFLLLSLAFLLLGCRKDEYMLSGDVALHFSRDTIHFDTLFSEVGSITQYLKVYNPYNKIVQVSEISLARRGTNTPFRLNISGIRSNYTRDVEIRPHDSLFIFVEVTTNNAEDIIMEKDSIIFMTNGVFQDVKLIAWGKAAHKVPQDLIIDKDTTLPADKPYLFFGNVTVAQHAKLTLPPGTELYFERNKGLTVYGSLRGEGSLEEPIIIRSSRLDEGYRDIPGLWNGIHFESTDSLVLQHTSIAQAVTALSIKPGPTDQLNTPVSLYNVKLQESSYAGIVATQTDMQAYNLLIANSGSYALRQAGGHHAYYHTSIANYYPSYYSIRTTPSVFVTDQIHAMPHVTSLHFYNSIVYGNNQNEFLVASDASDVNYSFNHCLIRIQQDLFPTSDPSIFNEVQLNKSPNFIDTTEDGDFQLKASSPAIDLGNPLYIGKAVLDMEGNDRTLNNPDAGAYEHIPEE